MRAWLEALKRQPVRAAALGLVVAATVYVIVWPLTRATYPPLTDLPFHAAQVSIIRHYFDPSFHFHEQFTIHPLEVPYVTMYGIGVAASWLVSIGAAVKIMAASMLVLLPLGLALLFHGLGKNPLWGALGLGFVWTDSTHWGFLSSVGAMGLYAAAVGSALLVLRAPSRRRQLALGLLLVAVFFTHVYRFPYAVLGVGLAAAVMYPATRCWRPLVAPVAVALGVFGLWLAVRPRALTPALGSLTFETKRFGRLGEFLFQSYSGPVGTQEKTLAWLMLGALAGAILLALAFRERKAPEASARAWARGTLVLPLLLALVHVVAYFTLPARLGEWWYVYPRELAAAAFVGVAAVPDLPRGRWLELGVIAVIALASARMAGFVAGRFAAFERDSADFRELATKLPRAPKLAYLVIDQLPSERPDSAKRHSPYVHFPGWIQAERGGWLSFHFASWGIFPVRYRDASPSVPPPVPRDWEWNPSWFRVREHGAFFDWFLVRLVDDPAPLFADDPTIVLVERRGTWWLYRRR